MCAFTSIHKGDFKTNNSGKGVVLKKQTKKNFQRNKSQQSYTNFNKQTKTNTLHLGMILDLQKSCRGDTEFPYTLTQFLDQV